MSSGWGRAPVARRRPGDPAAPPFPEQVVQQSSSSPQAHRASTSSLNGRAAVNACGGPTAASGAGHVRRCHEVDHDPFVRGPHQRLVPVEAGEPGEYRPTQQAGQGCELGQALTGSSRSAQAGPMRRVRREGLGGQQEDAQQAARDRRPPKLYRPVVAASLQGSEHTEVRIPHHASPPPSPPRARARRSTCASASAARRRA